MNCWRCNEPIHNDFAFCPSCNAKIIKYVKNDIVYKKSSLIENSNKLLYVTIAIAFGSRFYSFSIISIIGFISTSFLCFYIIFNEIEKDPLKIFRIFMLGFASAIVAFM